jgi:N6-adenosine-specific RNA methylase IME4
MTFKIITADLPWEYENERDNMPRMGGMTYTTMNLQALKDLGPAVRAVSEKDTVLFLWATFPKLREAFDVLDAWEFHYVTTPFVWVKLNPKGKLLEFAARNLIRAMLIPGLGKAVEKLVILVGGVYSGMGSWTNGNAEIVLMAKRRKSGAPKRIAKNVKQIILAPRGVHSAKPAELYARIETLLGPLPRLELFARQQQPGWVCIGSEITQNDIKVDLATLAAK